MEYWHLNNDLTIVSKNHNDPDKSKVIIKLTNFTQEQAQKIVDSHNEAVKQEVRKACDRAINWF